MSEPIRIGAVSYLNSRPLVYRLGELAAEADLRLEVPSLLASQLASGELDVALVPSIEYARSSEYSIVPGMAIAAHGPVLSVKLYCRKPIFEIQTLALDEGSRTSATLTRVLLWRQYGIRPDTVQLPLGVPAEEIEADAVLLIGDRAIRPIDLGQIETYDLGEWWLELTGLPFVFAMWVVRDGIDLGSIDESLRTAKEQGCLHINEIAAVEGPRLGLSVDEAITYLTQYIRFDLGPPELRALELYYRWASEADLAPRGVELVFYNQSNLAKVY